MEYSVDLAAVALLLDLCQTNVHPCLNADSDRFRKAVRSVARKRTKRDQYNVTRGVLDVVTVGASSACVWLNRQRKIVQEQLKLKNSDEGDILLRLCNLDGDIKEWLVVLCEEYGVEWMKPALALTLELMILSRELAVEEVARVGAVLLVCNKLPSENDEIITKEEIADAAKCVLTELATRDDITFRKSHDNFREEYAFVEGIRGLAWRRVDYARRESVDKTRKRGKNIAKRSSGAITGGIGAAQGFAPSTYHALKTMQELQDFVREESVEEVPQPWHALSRTSDLWHKGGSLTPRVLLLMMNHYAPENMLVKPGMAASAFVCTKEYASEGVLVDMPVSALELHLSPLNEERDEEKVCIAIPELTLRKIADGRYCASWATGTISSLTSSRASSSTTSSSTVRRYTLAPSDLIGTISGARKYSSDVKRFSDVERFSNEERF